MWDQHQTTEAMAVEALTDPDVAALVPDPKSRTGKSSRYIAFSPSADRVLVVEHQGQRFGANCWSANPTDQLHLPRRGHLMSTFTTETQPFDGSEAAGVGLRAATTYLQLQL